MPRTYSIVTACVDALSTDAKRREWQHALVLFEGFQSKRLEANTIIYNTSTNSCGTKTGWQHGLALIKGMVHQQLLADVVSLTSGISCERHGNWRGAMHLLEVMGLLQVRCNTISYSAALSCDAAAWKLLLTDMVARKIEGNTATYNSAMSTLSWQRSLQEFSNLHARAQGNLRTLAVVAGSLGSRWQRAIGVLSEDAHVMKAVITACAQGKAWAEALHLASSGLKVTAWNSVIGAVGWRLAIEIFHSLQELRVERDEVTRNALLKSMAEGSQWSRALEVGARDIVGWASIMTACDKGSQWSKVLQIFETLRSDNEVILNLAMHACETGGQWRKAVDVFASQDQVSLIAWDSLLRVCLENGEEEMAFKALLESSDLRDPSSFYWALATLAVGDPEVIHEAFRQAAVCRGGASEAARFLWSSATLGVETKLKSTEAVKAETLEDLSMAMVGMSQCEAGILLAAQKATCELLKRSHLDLELNAKGKELLAILFSARLVQCLSSELLQTSQKLMQKLGQRLDVATMANERHVYVKPAGWEVFGGHVDHQLRDFVIHDLGGPKPILMDSKHNFGFLHRLDIPSSGLILAASGYEAFYDLQVQLHAGDINRDYWVLCHGLMANSRDVRVSTWGRDDRPTCSGGRGKVSRSLLSPSHYCDHSSGAFSRLEVSILTGRKHQIRSHLAHLGHATVRDKIYSSSFTFKSDGVLTERNWLHRHRLTFRHGQKVCEASCGLPKDLARSLELFRSRPVPKSCL